MALWIIAGALLLVWLICILLGKGGGFIHILLLCACSVALVQWVGERRAKQEKEK